jgi:putative tryptophan/tyrosine transport system substrate-binding protein
MAVLGSTRLPPHFHRGLYGPAIAENYPQTANYVDRILRGVKIVELPFEEPTQNKLAINLRTARSIGMTVPPTLLARADEVIE